MKPTHPLKTVDQLAPILRALRTQKGMTQAELGLRLGVGQTRVARIEGSKGAVSVHHLMRYLQALGYELAITPLAASASERGSKASW